MFVIAEYANYRTNPLSSGYANYRATTTNTRP